MCQLKLQCDERTGESRRCRVNNEAKAFGDAHRQSCARHEKTLGRRTAERHRRAWGAVLVFVFVHPTGPDRATQTQSGVDDDTRPLNTLYHPSSPTCFQRVSCGPSRADAGRGARLGAVQVACGRGTRPAAGDCAASSSITLSAVHGRHCLYLAEPKCSK